MDERYGKRIKINAKIVVDVLAANGHRLVKRLWQVTPILAEHESAIAAIKKPQVSGIKHWLKTGILKSLPNVGWNLFVFGHHLRAAIGHLISPVDDGLRNRTWSPTCQWVF